MNLTNNATFAAVVALLLCYCVAIVVVPPAAAAAAATDTGAAFATCFSPSSKKKPAFQHHRNRQLQLQRQRTATPSPLQAGNDAGDGEDRRRQEILKVPLPVPPAWTAVERKRRRIERDLIAQLLVRPDGDGGVGGDEAIRGGHFRRLWFSERGFSVERVMERADLDAGKPETWPDAESALVSLIRDDPTYVEPYVRLSKLYCLQQRFDESKALALAALELRPWHFVALETMVAVHTAQRNELEARLWDAKRLPKPSDPERRKEWVHGHLREFEELFSSQQSLSSSPAGPAQDPSGQDEGGDEGAQDDSCWQ